MLLLWLTTIGFAISSSIDNFGVGVSYGVTKIHIGLIPNSIIAGIGFLFSLIGICGGRYLSTIIPNALSTSIAALFLCIIGIRIIFLGFRSKDSANKTQTKKRKSLNSYLENPEQADLDKSGQIGIVESFILGAAVSTNALSNGLGAGVIGMSPLALSLITSFFSFGTIWVGVRIGERVSQIRIGKFDVGQFSTIISGAILLLIALHMVLTVV